jgi:hypothetical protein
VISIAYPDGVAMFFAIWMFVKRVSLSIRASERGPMPGGFLIIARLQTDPASDGIAKSRVPWVVARRSPHSWNA